MQTLNLIPLLRERGVDIELVAGRGRGLPRRDIMAGAPLRRAIVPGTTAIASMSYSVSTIARLRRVRGEIDVLHAMGGRHVAGSVWAAHRLGIPALVKISRAGEMQDLKLLMHAPLGRFRAGKILEAAWFICQSSNVRSELLAMGVPAERLFDAPNGVDVSVHRPPTEDERTRARTGFGFGSETIITFSGRLVAVKGVETLIRACVDIPGARLLLLGDGTEMGRLRALAGNLGIADRVTFAGYTREVQKYLWASDIFVLPSASEGLSNSLLEALASGLPAVVTPVLDNQELRGEEVAPMLVAKPGRPAAWTESLQRLIDEPRLRASMGAAGARHIRNNLTLAHTADKIYDAYRRVSNPVRRTNGGPSRDATTP